ncbi:MAG: T9SS type A sorting domain-containing protein, partial [Ignavibacteriaceae bacterium]|nr:T9SS type A sorting domain-containing protein [Ignavibacteriaceae bacterium]
STGYWQNVWQDVHGAGAQRGDRKGLYFDGLTYVFDGYYLSMAPQGDATRILNYVRLVRDDFTTGIEDDQSENSSIPDEFILYQNYPNPFNPSTTISFSIPVNGNVSLKIFNVIGQQVDELVNENLSAGSYSYQWNADKQSSGVYFYKLIIDTYSEIKKMVLLK